MKRLVVRFALVSSVLFLTFPVKDAYAFSRDWDPGSIAARALSLVAYVPYAGTAVNGGLVWYAGMAGLITVCWYLGDLFLKRVRVEAGNVLDSSKWLTPGSTKPFALAALLLAGAACVWALLGVAILHLEARHEIVLFAGGKQFIYPAGSMGKNFGWLESAGWGALMLFLTWPVGNLLARPWRKSGS